MRRYLLHATAAACLLGPAAYADATTESQLRAALQAATAQVAQLEDQVANLQAAQAPDVAMIEALKAQVQTLSKTGGAAAQNPSDAAKNNAALAALKRQLAARNALLAKTETEYESANGEVSVRTVANGQLTGEVARLTGQVDTCDEKNAALYKLGNEILNAYAHKDDLFSTMASREPFIGFKRVELQNAVQDDQDKLFDNQVTPSESH